MIEANAPAPDFTFPDQDDAGDGHYRDFVDAPRLHAGKTYTVKIVIARPGADRVRVDSLFMRCKNPANG